MTFNLTEEQLPTFRPLPGHALIRTSPPPVKSDSGLLHIPQGIAHYQQEGSEVRKGEIVTLNRFGQNGGPDFWEESGMELGVGVVAYYWGHLNESDNQFVVVKIGQIVAVELPSHP